MEFNCRKIIVTIAISLFLLAADYFVSNLSYPVLDSVESLTWIDYFIPDDESVMADGNIMFVNTALDKELIDVTDEFGDVIGRTPVTDRGKLSALLSILSQTDYKYIFLDVRFEEGDVTGSDSTLFALIAAMPRFVFSNHRDMSPLFPDSIREKSARADYRGNFLNGFTRYEYLQDGEESVALRIYKDLSGKTISRKGPLYTSGGRLCYNMQFINFSLDDVIHDSSDGKIKYPYLGSEVLGLHSEDEIKNMARGKIIVIGDFDNDLHTTYLGEVPGPLLSVYAYRALADSDHIYSIWYFLITFIFYLLVTANLLGNSDMNIKICRMLKIHSPFLIFLSSLIGWSFLLTIIKIIVYLNFGISFLAVLPAATFSFITYIRMIRKYRNNNSDETPDTNNTVPAADKSRSGRGQ